MINAKAPISPISSPHFVILILGGVFIVNLMGFFSNLNPGVMLITIIKMVMQYFLTMKMVNGLQGVMPVTVLHIIAGEHITLIWKEIKRKHIN